MSHDVTQSEAEVSAFTEGGREGRKIATEKVEL